MQAGKEVSPAISIVQYHQPPWCCLERVATEKLCHVGQDPRFFADNSHFYSWPLKTRIVTWILAHASEEELEEF